MSENTVARKLFDELEFEIDAQCKLFGLPLARDRQQPYLTCWTIANEDTLGKRQLTVVDLAVTGSDLRFEFDINHNTKWAHSDAHLTYGFERLQLAGVKESFVREIREEFAKCFCTDGHIGRALVHHLAATLKAPNGVAISAERILGGIRHLLGESEAK